MELGCVGLDIHRVPVAILYDSWNLAAKIGNLPIRFDPSKTVSRPARE
jgi:hypothetical protein